jgi:hypothetical protein
VPREPGDHALGRSRGGVGTKLHLVTDGRGLPLAIPVRPTQAHESLYVAPVLNAVRIRQAVGRPRPRPARLTGDKGYSHPPIRHWLRAHHVGMSARSFPSAATKSPTGAAARPSLIAPRIGSAV